MLLLIIVAITWLLSAASMVTALIQEDWLWKLVALPSVILLVVASLVFYTIYMDRYEL